MPTSAFRISSGAASGTTLRSRESSSVPRGPSATRMKTGAPNGATPSRRSAPGTRPASTRPRMRCPAARPDRPSSACRIRTLSHAARAWAYAGAKSGAGVPVPPGSVTRGCPHAARPIVRRRIERASLLFSAKFLARRFDLVVEIRARDGLAIAVERLLPGGNRFLEQAAPAQEIAEMILNDRHGG